MNTEMFRCIDNDDVNALSAVLKLKSIDLWNDFEIEPNIFMTPLGYAIYTNRQKIVKYLVENWRNEGHYSHLGGGNGINLDFNCYYNRVQNEEMTPLALSRHKKLKDFEELLLV